MTVTNEFPFDITAREPTTRNYLRSNGMRFHIHTLPKVSFFCQSVNIPQVSLTPARQATRFVDIPHVGDKPVYSELSINFTVQENMENYIELYRWIVGIGFPNNTDEFKKLIQGESYRFPETKYASVNAVYSDASLMILNSDNNPIVRVSFYDAWPTSLSGFTLDVTPSDSVTVQATATFAYRYFEIEPLQLSSTP
jgi:hypothetical protein